MNTEKEYAKTQDEILKIQDNIMRGYNTDSVTDQNSDKSEKYSINDHESIINSTQILSDAIITETLEGKYSISKKSVNIGLCRYPFLDTVYFTNEKLFSVDALDEKENQKGLKYDKTFFFSKNKHDFQINLSYNPIEELAVHLEAGFLNNQTEAFEPIESEIIASFPLISKPELAINNQLIVYITFEQFFLDIDYNLEDKLSFAGKMAREQKTAGKTYYNQFKSGDEQIKLYKSGDLPLWGMKIYTDDSNALSILRQSALYEAIETENGTVLGCSLIGFELINGVKKLETPIDVYFDGRLGDENMKKVNFAVSFKYLPTLKNYYGNNVAFERNGVMSRNWYGSQFLSGHDGLSVALWDVDFV
ncbi:hypothetical protein QEN19_002691 [Hanseniaspora menglaensis]